MYILYINVGEICDLGSLLEYFCFVIPVLSQVNHGLSLAVVMPIV